jgi:hypothetical protein
LCGQDVAIAATDEALYDKAGALPADCGRGILVVRGSGLVRYDRRERPNPVDANHVLALVEIIDEGDHFGRTGEAGRQSKATGLTQ